MRTHLASLLILIGLAPSVLAGEPDHQARMPSVDPVEVGRLLLSENEEQRLRGTTLLLQRLGQGGQVAAFLKTMAAEQARFANAADRLVESWIEQVQSGTPTQQTLARRLLHATGPNAVRRLQEALRQAEPRKDVGKQEAIEAKPPEVEATAEATVPLPVQPPQGAQGAAASTPQAAARDDTLAVAVRADVLLVPRNEIRRWIEATTGAQAESFVQPELVRLLGGEVVASKEEVRGQRLRAILESLPDVRVVQRGAAGRASSGGARVLLDNRAKMRYRRDVRQTPKGAWTVDTDALPKGLEIRLSVTPAPEADLRFAIEARHVEVPTPLPVERERPAKNVEPVELDRPEWRVASARAEVDVTSEERQIVALFPDIVPNQIVLVHLRRPPLAPALKGK